MPRTGVALVLFYAAVIALLNIGLVLPLPRRLDLFAYFDAGIRNPGLRNFQPEPDVVVVPGVAGYDSYSERYQLVAEVGG